MSGGRLATRSRTSRTCASSAIVRTRFASTTSVTTIRTLEIMSGHGRRARAVDYPRGGGAGAGRGGPRAPLLGDRREPDRRAEDEHAPRRDAEGNADLGQRREIG